MKKYLGDAVYYEPNGYGVTLTTEDGITATNTIYLEPEVVAALLHALGNDDAFNREKLREAIGS